jgi:hypothetical protein
MKKIVTIVLIVLGVFFLIGMISTLLSKDETKTDNATKTIQTEATQKKTDEITKWEYEESVDKMDGTTTKTASVPALNKIEFDFPYGKSSFSLNVTKNGERSHIYLYCTKCQFVAGVAGEKLYRVKFDDESPFNVTAIYSSAGRMDIVFLGSETQLISKLKAAKKLIVEAEFFKEGYKTIDFNVSGFKWE